MFAAYFYFRKLGYVPPNPTLTNFGEKKTLGMNFEAQQK
jgi:hypothetical protein